MWVERPIKLVYIAMKRQLGIHGNSVCCKYRQYVTCNVKTVLNKKQFCKIELHIMTQPWHISFDFGAKQMEFVKKFLSILLVCVLPLWLFFFAP